MSYYAKVLQPDETVKYIGKLHWTIYRNAIALGLLTVIVALFALNIQQDHRPIVLLGAGILALLTLVSFLGHWFVRSTTEIVVTDKRVIHKTGWIARRTEEINITKVETVDVRQGVLDRIVDFRHGVDQGHRRQLGTIAASGVTFAITQRDHCRVGDPVHAGSMK